MTLKTPRQDLVKQLRRQLAFLRTSVAAYDAGDVEEAVRIAVAIRVLFHEGGRGSSLFKQMDQKATLQLVTTARAVPEPLEKIIFAELLEGMIFGDPLAYEPVIDVSTTLACSDWWVQAVFVQDSRVFTRADVVLSAANKDGGAHVDAPDAKLQALQDGFWSRVSKNADGTETEVPIVDDHFRLLRRFADELLCSPALLQLIE